MKSCKRSINTYRNQTANTIWFNYTKHIQIFGRHCDFWDLKAGIKKTNIYIKVYIHVWLMFRILVLTSKHWTQHVAVKPMWTRFPVLFFPARFTPCDPDRMELSPSSLETTGFDPTSSTKKQAEQNYQISIGFHIRGSFKCAMPRC